MACKGLLNKNAIGRKIVHINTNDAALEIKLENCMTVWVIDRMHLCCETRYMQTDDTLSAYIGTLLLDIRLAKAATAGQGYGTLESQFLIIRTSIGEFTVVSYNRHNGNYSGFDISCDYIRTKMCGR